VATVELRGVRKRFGDVQVVHGVDLTVPDGEFMMLIKPSGCGKSTLLRIVAGLEEASDGQVLIDGAVVNERDPKDRDVAMVFQDYALYPHMSVAENMGFSLRWRGASRPEIARRVAAAADVLDIAHLLERRPRELSGGQRQRVAMGRAIVRDPKVFLFDEPLSNLDAKLRVQMRTEIRELHQRLSTTTVYVTHDQIEAMTMADKIVVMQGGHIEQVGSPLEVYDRPVNTFVAGFIGSPSMNMLDAVVRHDGAAVFAEVAGTRLPLEQPLEDGREVTVGLRPEHLQPADEGLPGQIAVVEPTGAETYLIVRVGTKEVTAVLRDRRAMRPGQEIRLRAEPGMVHVFDKATGQRL